MAGWLYVISGLSLALVLIAAVLPPRSLRGLSIQRQPIRPVSAGDALLIELEIHNPTNRPKPLLQVLDGVPPTLAAGVPAETAIEVIPPHQSYRWRYEYPQYASSRGNGAEPPKTRRGIYRWQTVQVRTAAPLGLFWCRRSHSAKATAVVYPTVLPLSHCPLIDQVGQDASDQIQSSYQSQSASEGLTQSLRPYRWGDSIRLIHWRTSARYGELRVRELEIFTAGQDVIIALDSGADWQPDDFEQAVVAAASLYFYAKRSGLQTQIWTAATGLVQGEQAVLATLAGVISGETAIAESRPAQSCLWLSCQAQSLSGLSMGSRWILWPPPVAGSSHQSPQQSVPSGVATAGLVVSAAQPLQVQLQAPLSRPLTTR
jgi:uncharacterized protein (DUF58 family)